MRRSTFPVCILIAPLLVSCAATRQMAVLETVGPGPLQVNGTGPRTDGFLKVYSLRGLYNDEGIHYHPHTSYTVYSSDNRRLKEVKNALFPHDEEPVSVTLPVGTYAVEALAEGYKRVRVPVVI